MLKKCSYIIVPFAVFMSGLYGGIGFFTLMGGNPSVNDLSLQAFAEYWQNIDHYMGSRMPVFGGSLILVLLLGVISLLPWRKTVSFWLMLLGLLLLISDLVFTLSINHPLNQLIQSWDLQNLPSNVQEIKTQVIDAFWYRAFFMLSSFACVWLAAFLKKNKQI